MFRQRSGSSLCYACGKLNRADAAVCFYCGRRNPGLWGFGPSIGRLIGGLDFAGLVTVVSVVAYIASLALDPRAAIRASGVFDILAPSWRALAALGMAGAIPWEQGHWWTVLIFTVSGVVCFLVSDLVGTPYTVGASGAIFGLLSAMVWYGRSRGGFFGSAVLRQYGTWALVLFVFGLIAGTGVNNWGHAGGLLGGFLAAFVVGPIHERPEQGGDRLLAGVTLALTGLAFVLQLWTVFVP